MKHIIETERLYLRELELTDAPALSLVLSNHESMKFYPHPFSQEEVVNWINHNIFRYSVYGYGLWGMVLKTNNNLIGDCGISIQNIDDELLPEIGFHIIPKYAKHGYTSEAGNAVIEYAAKEFRIRKIFAYCEKGNIASQKTMQKIGLCLHKTYTECNIEKVVYVKTL